MIKSNFTDWYDEYHERYFGSKVLNRLPMPSVESMQLARALFGEQAPFIASLASMRAKYIDSIKVYTGVDYATQQQSQLAIDTRNKQAEHKMVDVMLQDGTTERTNLADAMNKYQHDTMCVEVPPLHKDTEPVRFTMLGSSCVWITDINDNEINDATAVSMFTKGTKNILNLNTMTSMVDTPLMSVDLVRTKTREFTPVKVQFDVRVPNSNRYNMSDVVTSLGAWYEAK